MRDGGVQVLLIYPVRVGGPDAARMWSTAAELTGVELALVAHEDVAPVAELASTLRAATQPLVVAGGRATAVDIVIGGAPGQPGQAAQPAGSRLPSGVVIVGVPHKE